MFILVLLAILIVPIIVLKIYLKATCANCKSKVCLNGKTALVTGGNSGIGYQIVLALASRGCRIIIADKVKDPNLERNIFNETNNADVKYMYVDFASFRSIREFAKELVKAGDKIDILINNAGITSVSPRKTEDGLDEVMQVNYFAPFLLTHLLVGLLKKSPSARIVFTSSYLSRIHHVTVDNLRPGVLKGDYHYYYPDSKFCVIVAADGFAEKLKESDVTSNSFHPGIVHTTIFAKALNLASKFDSSSVFTKIFQIGSILVGKTPEEGAQTAIHLACSKEVQDITGEFFGEMQSISKPKSALDRNFCRQIWSESEKIVGLEPSEKL